MLLPKILKKLLTSQEAVQLTRNNLFVFCELGKLEPYAIQNLGGRIQCITSTVLFYDFQNQCNDASNSGENDDTHHIVKGRCFFNLGDFGYIHQPHFVTEEGIALIRGIDR